MPENTSSGHGRLLLHAGVAAVAAILLYSGTLGHGFVYDDIDIAQRNPLARDPGDLGQIFGSHYWAGVHERGNLYRPLTIWTLALNHAAGGGDPAGYHATNAALHGAVSALVVLLASALGLGSGGSLVAGLLFAFHPIHVEAVAPVVGRSELLAALFVLGGWLAHLASARMEGSPRRLAVAGAALLFGAGLLSKENAAVLPALVLAGEIMLGRGRGWRSALPTVAAMAAVGLAVFLVRSQVISELMPDDPWTSVFTGVDPFTRILTATGVLGRYLWLILYPVNLSADYSYHQIPLVTSPLEPLFLVSALAHAGLLAAAVLLVRRGRLSGLGLLTYLLAIFPVSNLPLSVGTVMGERLLYLPSAGLCLLAPALVVELAGGPLSPFRRRIAAGAMVAVCGLYGARVLDRNLDWRDQHTLFSVTVKSSPRSAKAWYNLGVAEDDRGNLEAAVDAYRRAVEIKPDMAEAHRNLGLALLAGDRAAAALVHLREAARLDAGIPDVHSDLGVALFRLGRLAEAEEAFRREIARHPEAARAWYNLGTVLLEGGRPDRAVEPLTRAAQLAPRDVDVLAQLGVALQGLGRHAEALAALEKAAALDPGMADLLLTLADSAEAAGRPGVAARARALARDPGGS